MLLLSAQLAAYLCSPGVLSQAGHVSSKDTQ